MQDGGSLPTKRLTGPSQPGGTIATQLPSQVGATPPEPAEPPAPAVAAPPPGPPVPVATAALDSPPFPPDAPAEAVGSDVKSSPPQATADATRTACMLTSQRFGFKDLSSRKVHLP